MLEEPEPRENVGEALLLMDGHYQVVVPRRPLSLAGEGVKANKSAEIRSFRVVHRIEREPVPGRGMLSRMRSPISTRSRETSAFVGTRRVKNERVSKKERRQASGEGRTFCGVRDLALGRLRSCAFPGSDVDAFRAGWYE